MIWNKKKDEINKNVKEENDKNKSTNQNQDDQNDSDQNKDNTNDEQSANAKPGESEAAKGPVDPTYFATQKHASAARGEDSSKWDFPPNLAGINKDFPFQNLDKKIQGDLKKQFEGELTGKDYADLHAKHPGMVLPTHLKQS